MKVTAFIRKTSAKNNTTDLARIYFRLRDKGGVDIKAASELSINPNHWSAERQGYKPRVALVSDEKRLALEKAIAEITHLIAEEYHRGVDGAWLQSLIEEYHHPNINSGSANRDEAFHLVYQIQQYINEQPLSQSSKSYHTENINKIKRYELFQQEVMHRRGFKLCIDSISADDIREYREWLLDEHNLYWQYPVFYKDVRKVTAALVRSENTITDLLLRLRTVMIWCNKKGLTRNNPFDKYRITPAMYGDPFYLTLEERDRLLNAELNDTLAVYRDIFVFQCLIGCRAGDLNTLTKANLVDGAVEYIPQKTKNHEAKTVRVPLNSKAKEILSRYESLEEALVPRFELEDYNVKIKKIFKSVGLDRKVIVLDPKTRKDVAKPLYEVVTSHVARKTFIGNLYKKVKDPCLISSMSGHSENSRAFTRYRKIDDDMKVELVNMLE